MLIDFESFVDEISREFEGKIERERISSLLKVEDDYELDLREAANTRLTLQTLKFVGKKSDGTEIKFEYAFKSGIDIWIADNFKGKSSVFKMLKFALTGDNSLKGDVQNWITRILLTFSLDDEPYSILLNREGARLSAQLVEGHSRSVTEFEKENLKPVLSASSETKLEKRLQEFFFRKFGYYSLQWTQKSPVKDSLDLLEAGISWKTIFSSIYLESKDSSSLLFGDQGKKVFQMLLGLELTFPINRLSVKKDMLNNELAKARASAGAKPVSAEDKTREERLKDINAEIGRIQKEVNKEADLSAQYQTYASLIGQLNSANAAMVKNADRLRVLYTDRAKTEGSLRSFKDESANLQKEIDKDKSEIIRLNEYLESTQFFANLDIKHCPSCNQSVAPGKQLGRECVLCHRDVDRHLVDDNMFRAKISDLESAVASNEKLRQQLAEQESQLKPQLEQILARIKSGEAEHLPDVENLRKELEQVEAKINAEKKNAQLVGTDLTKLISEKAVIEYQLSPVKDNAPGSQVNQFEVEIEILAHAIQILETKRLENAATILGNLEKLMLAEIQQFGLTSITDVKIDDNFEIKYKQDDNYIKFSAIVEGEKLRAKLALYLSLMQLEAEQNVGRHVRFLIVDSPAKEEGDSKYLEGLSDVLKGIEERFGDKLQILIGTAERKLAGVVKNERIFAEDKYVF